MKVHANYIDRLRLQAKVQPKNHDLCVPFKGSYIDIICRYDGTWSLRVNNRDSGERHATRIAAIDYLEEADIGLTFI